MRACGLRRSTPTSVSLNSSVLRLPLPRLHRCHRIQPGRCDAAGPVGQKRSWPCRRLVRSSPWDWWSPVNTAHILR